MYRKAKAREIEMSSKFEYDGFRSQRFEDKKTVRVPVVSYAFQDIIKFSEK
ncbi:MAG: hypothetical protein A4E50_00069 [Methanosaeta sp. PtaB.Bin087]|nr:MAG: hypothetical protein A4E50_00069 [Methanosaeta sp. PtaB.Bin087]